MSQRWKPIARLTCLTAVMSVGLLHAQSITVNPTGYVTAAVGGTVQFSATVSGLTSSDVVWSVGRPGMNTGLGSISAQGLYTAPSTLPSNTQVQITATSKVNTAVSGVTFVYILPLGPVITSVTPYPLPTGNRLLRVYGTGFQAGAFIWAGGVRYSAAAASTECPLPTCAGTTIYQGAATSILVYAANQGSATSNVLTVPVIAAPGSSGGGSGSGGGTTSPVPVVSPATVTLALGSTQQFTANNTTSWAAASGSITSAGLYTAPSVMPASGTDTVGATGPGGTGKATVQLVSNVPPVIQSLGLTPLPLGVFSTTINGTGFTSLSIAKLNGSPLAVTANTPTQLTVAGFAGSGGTVNVTVANGPVVSQPFPVQVGVQNALVSPSAARRFLQQAAFGATPADAAHVQAIGFQAWLTEQFNMAQVSNYAPLASGSAQSGIGAYFLANAVTNPDQLRQRVSFALSQIFVTSMNKLIWYSTMVPYQHMLLADAFSNYGKILGDVTLSPAMGMYLDMANNAKANPALGTVANENYAREIMQLFSIGTVLLNQDGTQQVSGGAPIPAYSQTNVTELARVFTGWTYAPKSGNPVWGAYINPLAPMVPYIAQHDFGSKTLLNGYVAQANLSPQADLQGALDNLITHPNTAPFISKQLIQHMVKSNPTPAYVKRVADVFTQTAGDMKAVVTAILLDQEARANDAGGLDQATDGHLQEPALLLPGYIRAFGGQMTIANYYASDMAAQGQDIYSPPSVFNYYSPGYTVAGTGGLKGPEFQLYNPNASILRENMIASFFNAYSNPVQSYGPGTSVDLSPFLPLAATPSTLVDALDLTLTGGTMPSAMKTIVAGAVSADANGALHRVQTGIYLILTSSYYSVWH